MTRQVKVATNILLWQLQVVGMAEVVRSLDFAEESVSSSKGEPLRVVLRIRPLTADENVRGEESAVVVRPKNSELEVKTRNRTYHKGSVRDLGHANYKFSCIYDKDATQEHVFETTTRPLVQSLFDGKDGLLFAYGTTNAGKTYTIQGSNQQERGILYRASELITKTLAGEQTGITRDKDSHYELCVSALEIYNEQCFDLLDTKKRERPVLRIKEDTNGSVRVNGLQNVTIENLEGIESILIAGLRRRRIAGTSHNDRSSRSHMIVMLSLKRYVNHRGSVNELIETATLSIVDLAGSERSNSLGLSDIERVREASQINKSLMNLARCLEVLRENQKRKNGKKLLVPYRQSRLTRLFQPSLERGSAVMIVNISPCLSDADETIHALNCAALACQVQVGTEQQPLYNKENVFAMPRVCKPDSWNHELAAERRRNAVLEAEIERLQEVLSKAESRMCLIESEVRQEAAEEMEHALAEMETEYARRLDEAMESNDRRTERRIELVTQTARKKISKRTAENLVDGAMTNKYKEWWEEEKDQRQFEEEYYQMERDKLVDRICDLETRLEQAGLGNDNRLSPIG
eukprot:Plantae.Rhodophyta-Purpureofilum_apyrenoidigerum.ctg10578.p1 GENE.Plantae.Rhodophyta-Purpureofilum_apyrenoidigerum.ctg10578~~Plantae.Rhodophyta-Purpureofilum_apyrenoidigerum.ctg10578.p1  ORF type:complete len:577 (-),score=123.43 Plantae.Rhodophyta-Purpureofilum_apyrenoidigerum.ctg10578:86-1816(-)